ncbi:DUF742 domain-containing protein [Streptomyces sp. NPDC093252]|uniref:DUF742 domain-containing protein n=1 Tax=Streptomyces sp. NPDC093252 TaxID=3154980 RepID=UPI00341B8C32
MAGGTWGEVTPRVPYYAITSGRTEADVTLLLETQVRALPENPPHGATPEQEQVLRLCAGRDLSVVELAGTLRLPAPVVKVLVSDLFRDGALRITVPRSDRPGTEGSDPAVLTALLANLQRRWGVNPHAA